MIKITNTEMIQYLVNEIVKMNREMEEMGVEGIVEFPKEDFTETVTEMLRSDDMLRVVSTYNFTCTLYKAAKAVEVSKQTTEEKDIP